MANVRKTDTKKETSKIRLRVQAYEPRALDDAVKQILDVVTGFDVEVSGPIPLPTRVRRYSVNRSSFIAKTSQEQYEMRVHTRILDITNPVPQVIEALSNLSLSAGVSVEVRMM